MLRDMCALFLERKEFFLKLLWEHLEISMISILIAIVLGGLVGILISEYQQSAKPAMGAVSYTHLQGHRGCQKCGESQCISALGDGRWNI